MIRAVAPLLAVALLTAALSAQDADPIKEKLFVAKRAYDSEMRQVHTQLEAWLDKREEAARKTKDVRLADQVKEDRAAYDGEFHRGTPAAIRMQHDRALRVLEAAYKQAHRDYAAAGRDTEAEAVDAELRRIGSRLYAVDLLALVNTKTHTLSGQWVKDEKGLSTTTTETDHSRLQLPYEPGEEYDVEVRCKRSVGAGAFGFGLVAGGRQVIAVVDSWPSRGHGSGLQLLDGKEPIDGNLTTVRGQVMQNDRFYTLTYVVRSDRVEVTLDGKPLFSFRGDLSRLSAFKNYVPPNRKALFLFVAWKKSGVEIESMLVRPVRGKGTILK